MQTKSEKLTNHLKKAFLAFFVVSVTSFIGFKLYPLIHGPKITVGTLTNGGSVTEPMVRVAGTAAYTQHLSMNGKALNLSPDGSFDDRLVLSPGYNVIALAGTDRFGKVTEQSYAVVLDEPGGRTLSLHALSPAVLEQDLIQPLPEPETPDATMTEPTN